MLIIALGVLALMVILGTAFASLMRLEKRATENYVEGSRMDALLDSAVDRVIAQLNGSSNFKSWANYRELPWLFQIAKEDDLAHGRYDVDDARVGKWEVFAEQVGQVYSYKTKVIDTQSQINLNGRQDTLARMLDNLGDAIDRSVRLKIGGREIWNPLYTAPRRRGDKVTGAHIVNVRRRFPGGRFTSKTQLLQIIGPENYELIKDFVTVHSWEDPNTYKATDGLDQVIDPSGLGSSGLGAGTVGGSGFQPQPEAYMTASRVDSEPRYPINVNTAPPEVLVAVIEGLAGRRVFPYSKLGSGGSMMPVDQNANITGQRIIAQEEFRDVTPRAVFVYTPRLEYEHAQRIAQQIVGWRKQRPFMTWRTNNEAGVKGFEDFINDLEDSYFPSPANCVVVDPDMPANRQLTGSIMGSGGATPVGRLWVKGHATGGAGRQLRRQLSLPMHDQYAWYFEAIKGVLNANFNPNTRINRYGPNAPAYMPVDKSDLVWGERGTNRIWKGHTTELCFDTNGIYEVTVLARITRRPVIGSSTTAVGGSGVDPFARPDYERKYRAIVQIFDRLTHTNQLQFEQSFRSQGRSSKNDRKFVVTWPEPMAAMTELGTAGTPRDGRVELAGFNDGLRLQMPPQMRMQFFRNFQSVLMGMGFQDRDGTSLARLKRIRTSGAQVGAQGDEYSDALRDLFDAHNRQDVKSGEYYRRSRLQQMNVFKNPNAQWMDPLISKEVLGTDVFPDRLNTSILRMTHLGTRHLVLPSRSKIGDLTRSQGNVLVGESGRGTRGQNVLYGNVPYYKGGIAFWVKFDFNGDDPVFSGLIGNTSVIRSVQPTASDYTGSEGSQFYIFKNSVGQLRIVRVYYHQAFMETVGSEGGSAEADAQSIRLFPDPGASDPAGGGGAGGLQNPILEELDQKKLISRSDIVFDVKHFKAHEWHHIAVDWDDENTVYPIRLYLDFQEVREGAAPRMAQSLVDAIANSWVRLNERQPKDSLQVGGIVRDQGVSDAGLFKWFTNTAKGQTGVGGIQTVAASVKRLMANATIDEVITYEGTFTAARQFYGGRQAPGYFSVQPGEYANVFEVPLPPDIEHVILRSFDWTSYYPTSYTDSRANSVAQPFQQRTAIRCRLYFRTEGAPPTGFVEPWRNPSVDNMIAGRRALASVGSLMNQRKAEVVYNFTITGFRSPGGNSAGGVVQTPVIDDVTLTYFLPHPKILLMEEAQ